MRREEELWEEAIMTHEVMEVGVSGSLKTNDYPPFTKRDLGLN